MEARARHIVDSFAGAANHGSNSLLPASTTVVAVHLYAVEAFQSPSQKSLEPDRPHRQRYQSSGNTNPITNVDQFPKLARMQTYLRLSERAGVLSAHLSILRVSPLC